MRGLDGAYGAITAIVLGVLVCTAWGAMWLMHALGVAGTALVLVGVLALIGARVVWRFCVELREALKPHD